MDDNAIQLPGFYMGTVWTIIASEHDPEHAAAVHGDAASLAECRKTLSECWEVISASSAPFSVHGIHDQYADFDFDRVVAALSSVTVSSANILSSYKNIAFLSSAQLKEIYEKHIENMKHSVSLFHRIFELYEAGNAAEKLRIYGVCRDMKFSM
jgi:hypothetical protein